jgi:anaerobic selenocysteine-containing dehydrogenase
MGGSKKTGCSTNVDRVAHLNHKATEPPGEARSDLDIFVDFARRRNFRRTAHRRSHGATRRARSTLGENARAAGRPRRRR